MPQSHHRQKSISSFDQKLVQSFSHRYDPYRCSLLSDAKLFSAKFFHLLVWLNKLELVLFVKYFHLKLWSEIWFRN